MDYSWFDLVGNVGVLLMVVAYLLLQLEEDVQLGSQLLVVECGGRDAGNHIVDVSLQSFGSFDGSILVVD